MNTSAQVATQPGEMGSHSSETGHLEVVERRLGRWEKTWNRAVIRKATILIAMAVLWECYARWLGNPLVIPTFVEVLRAFATGVWNGELPGAAWQSLKLLLAGYSLGVGLGSVLAVLAITTRIGNDVLETLTAMFNPLPAIALLPLALIWFGLSQASLIFVLVHSVIWPVALNAQSGFMAVSPTLRMVGRNAGLRGMPYAAAILVPAALVSILAGLKIGWAFAWRTLIAAELVFGVSSSSGGLGWFIYLSKNDLEIPKVFAGLFTIIIIGLVIENVVFRNVEARTVRRWGMHS